MQLLSGFPQFALFNLIVFVAVGLFEITFRTSGNGSSRSILSEANGHAVAGRTREFALPSLFAATPPAIQAMDASQRFARVWTNSYAPDIRPNRLMAYGKYSAQIYSPLALERNTKFVNSLSPAMLNLMGIRYIIEPASSPPETAVVPPATLPLDFLREKVSIPSTRVVRVEVTSYTNGTANLSDGTVVGELSLASPDSNTKTIPVRLGMEAAKWNIESIRSAVKHNKPLNSQEFSVNLPEQRNSRREKFVARYDLPAPILVNQIAASSSLKNATLTIDQIALYDEAGRSFSALTLAGLNDYALVQIDNGGVMYENRDALARAFVVHRAEVVDDAQVIAQMGARDFQPDRITYLAEGEALNRSSEFEAARVADQVSVIEYRPERVGIRARTIEAGYLILADSWYPGWVASVNGVRAEINRADFIFRAVKLSAGEHTVVFEYQPTSFAWGAVLSALGVIAAIGLIVVWKIR